MPKLTRALRILFLSGFLVYTALSVVCFLTSSPLFLCVGSILFCILFLLFYLSVRLSSPVTLIKLCVWMHLFLGCTILQTALSLSPLSGLSFIGVPLFCVLGIFLNLPRRAGNRAESLFLFGTELPSAAREKPDAGAGETFPEDPYGSACLREEVLSLKAFLEGHGHYLRYAPPSAHHLRLILFAAALLGGAGCIGYFGFGGDHFPVWGTSDFWFMILGAFLILFGLLQIPFGPLRGAVFSAVGFLLVPGIHALIRILTPFFYRSPFLCIICIFLAFLFLLLVMILGLELYRATHYTGIIHYMRQDSQAGAVLDDLSLRRIPDFPYSMEMQMAVPHWMQDEQVDTEKSLNTLLFHIRRFADEHRMMLMGYRREEETFRILFALDGAVTREQAEDWGKQLALLLIKLHVFNSHVSIQDKPAISLYKEELYPSVTELSSIYNEEISRILDQRRTSMEDQFEVVYMVAIPSPEDAAAFSSVCENYGWTVEQNPKDQNPYLGGSETILLIHFFSRLGLSRMNLNSNQVLETLAGFRGELLGWHLQQDVPRSEKRI